MHQISATFKSFSQQAKIKVHTLCASFVRLQGDRCASRCRPRAQWVNPWVVNQFSKQGFKASQGFVWSSLETLEWSWIYRSSSCGVAEAWGSWSSMPEVSRGSDLFHLASQLSDCSTYSFTLCAWWCGRPVISDVSVYLRLTSVYQTEVRPRQP